MRTRTQTSYLIFFSSPLLPGVQCGECSAGFYGNPGISGAPCRPCACNNNIDVTDAGSCSPVTGECLKCLYNTQGPSCQLCKPGYFGYFGSDLLCMSKSAKLLAGNEAAWPVVATPILPSVRSVVPAPSENGPCPERGSRDGCRHMRLSVALRQELTGGRSVPFGTAHFSTCPGGFEVFFLRVCTPVHSARITQGWRWSIIMQIPGLCLRPTELDLWGDGAQESAL